MQCDVIFLMCSERSGSNLVTKLFDSHSNVCGPSTAHLADILIPNLYRYDFSNSGQWKIFLEDAIYLLKYKNARWEKKFTLDELIGAIDVADVKGFFHYIYGSELLKNNKQTLFVKENRIYEYQLLLSRIFPNAKYLYVYRDPRDMAASWKNGHAMRGGVVKSSKTWLSDQLGFLRMRSYLGSGRVPVFSYEQLLASPASILAESCKGLELNYQKSMLDFHLTERVKKNAKAGLDWKNISKPLIMNNSGKYKTQLSCDEIQYVENVCWELMVSMGYQPETEKLNNLQFLELEKAMIKIEPFSKPGYEEMSQQEKYRRKLQHEKRGEIFNRDFRL